MKIKIGKKTSFSGIEAQPGGKFLFFNMVEKIYKIIQNLEGGK